MTADGNRLSTADNSLLQEQCNLLRERLLSTISSLVLFDAPILNQENSRSPPYNCKYKGLGEEIASWKRIQDNAVEAIKQKYMDLKKELNTSNQHLEVSKDRYQVLEREFHLLKGEKDALLVSVSNSSQTLALVTDQKEKALQDLRIEAQRRKDLEEQIKKFNTAFSYRQKSLVSFQSDFKSIIDNLKAQNPVSLSKAHGS